MTLKRPQKFTLKCVTSQKFVNLSSVILLALFLTACGTAKEVIDNVKDEIQEEPVQIAFAGGGWRAHTGHSAWTIGLLDGKHTLDEVFDNVGIVSSNSGGSWFSTMLMYSPKFVSDIEAANANNDWTTKKGWLHYQKLHFDTVACKSYKEGYEHMECVIDSYTGISKTGVSEWKLVCDKLIYRDYPLPGVKLGHAHQPWAKKKALLLASSLLTNSVVLNKYRSSKDNHRYYQACIAPNTAVLDERLSQAGGSYCSNNPDHPIDVSAVTFSSVPTNNSIRIAASPFFAELGNNVHSGTFNLGYTEDFVFSDPQRYRQKVSNPINTDNVLVVNAAAASSAAGGFGASARVTGSLNIHGAKLEYDFALAYLLEDDAISFSLETPEINYIDAKGLPLDSLSKKKVVRLADGGAVDNSGVAQLVRSLQLHSRDDGFNIVAFDNVGDITYPAGGGVPVGIDIASLFGAPDPFKMEYKDILSGGINVPDFQIFEKGPLNSTDTTWTYSVEDSPGINQLIYTRYEVVTKENKALGISGGSTGTLHAFTCSYPKAGIAPDNNEQSFIDYHLMFNFIVAGLKEHGGLKHLRSAFGLPNE